MRLKSQKDDDYDKRLLQYITEYTRNNKVPPSLDMIIENVPGRASKSTVFNKLQKMVDAKLLVQKNKKGYYYPTSLETKEVSVPLYLLKEACTKLIESPDNALLVKRLSEYINNNGESNET